MYLCRTINMNQGYGNKEVKRNVDYDTNAIIPTITRIAMKNTTAMLFFITSLSVMLSPSWKAPHRDIQLCIPIVH